VDELFALMFPLLTKNKSQEPGTGKNMIAMKAKLLEQRRVKEKVIEDELRKAYLIP
jgi:hypothetical protein